MHSLRLFSRLLANVLIFRYVQLPCLAAQCYYPNGDLAEDSPCDPDAEVGPCCGRGLGTTCLNNDLCKGPDGNVVRGSCTDKEWGDGCPLYCIGQSTGGTDLISCSNVTHSDTSYCCDHVSGGCCDGGVGRFDVFPSDPITTATWDVVKDQFVKIASSTTNSSATSSSITTSTSTSTSSSTSTSQSSSSSSSTTTTTITSSSSYVSPTSEPATSESTAGSAPTGLSTGGKAGIGVGIGLGAVILAVLAYFIWLVRKKNRTATQILPQAPALAQQPDMAYAGSKWPPPQELSYEPTHSSPRYELPATH
ncbi:hypothetical protein GGR52DRAFT_545653 [Hypoxylon sp. FL1284]|nr:hypothetical protein GGR52DRAFT_545653 [Hypoxylon sp. FL1284]